MITIISGTNRQDSNTYKVATIYKENLNKLGATSQILDLRDLPRDFVFTALYENAGKDEAFSRFNDLLKNSNKFVFIVPEYNGSFPGILKSFIDGLSYPSPFLNKKGALVGISTGVMAGALALSHLTDILNYLGLNVLANKPRLARVDKILDAENNSITDKFLSDLIESQARQLLAF